MWPEDIFDVNINFSDTTVLTIRLSRTDHFISIKSGKNGIRTPSANELEFAKYMLTKCNPSNLDKVIFDKCMDALNKDIEIINEAW